MTLAYRSLTIDAPPFKPSAYGLLSVARVVEDAGLRPMAGGTFISAAAGNTTSNVIDLTDCISPQGGMQPKVQNLTETWLAALPVVAYGEWQCAPAGVDYQFAQDEAQRMFIAGESREVESVVWAYWTSLGACTSGTGVVDALGLAEDAIGDTYGGEGVIHATRYGATQLAAINLVERNGATLRTVAAGTPVVVGDGYTANKTLFATGAVTVVRGPLESLTPTPGSAMGRASNDLFGMVERSYLVAADNPIACFTFP
jgi:hypothetical protein